MRKLNERGGQAGAGRLFLPAILAAAIPGTALAQEEVVTEKLQHGEVNWTEKTVLATGSGAPNLELANVAAIRLAAERAAQASAYRNILEAIKGVRITARKLAAEQLGEVQIKTQIEGIVSGCKTVETRYFSDKGVDVVVQCRLDGGLAMVLAPPKPYKPIETAGERKYTGLVIDAVGLKVKPSLEPRILEADGNIMYSQEVVKPQWLRKHGAAAFYRSVDGAKKNERLGDNPMVLRAAATGDMESDVRLSGEEVERLKAENLWFLLEGRVAIATDGP